MAYIGLSPVVGEFRKLDDISGQFDNSTSTFNLTVAGSAVSAGSAQNLIISVDGIIQEPQASFTVGGSTLSFTEAPNTASTFFGILLGSVAQVGVPSDDTVSSVKLQANSVTTAKIIDNAVSSVKLQANSVTTAKIIDNAVTNAKLNLTYSSSEFLANGSGNVFTVDTGHDANSILVFVNGICMLPVTDYGVSGTTLTLLFTPVANSNVSVRYFPV
jgi:hypothetical protein